MAEEVKSLVDVYYGDTLIGQVANGETGNVNCTGHEMTDDIHIKVPYDMKAIRLQTKSATVNENGQKVIFPDDGYVMSAAVLTVEVPSDNEWLGEFDADTEYRVGSIVSQNDMVYICIVKPTNNQPPTDTTYWELLSGKIQDEKIVDIITHGRLEFLPDEGYIAVRKFTANVAETPTFDGTINIESGYTTISGSYLIDEQKAYTVLNSLSGVKTYNVSFGAGGPPNGGDEINFTSMTFDATNGLILYNDKGAFAMNGGFDEYTANYGDGNGARVNFEEGTECRKEFKELFLSIADEYSAEETESLVGTWLLNDTLTFTSDLPTAYFELEGTINTIDYATNKVTDAIENARFTYTTTGTSSLYIATEYFSYNYFYSDGSIRVSNDDDNLDLEIGDTDYSWYKTITLTAEPTNQAFITWLKANATKQGAVSLITFTIDGTTYQAEDGMTWEQWLSSEYNTGSYYTTGGWIRKSNSNIVGLSVGNPVFAWNNISANTAYVIITTSGLGPEPS